MNYEIIKDKSQLEQFINWLPENKKHERFYLSLMARNKYCKPLVDLGNNETSLHKIICDKKEILSKIMQMECPIGSYTHKGKVIPQQGLAVYINPNPRDLIRANKAIGRKCTDLGFEGTYNGYNPYRVTLSEIQKAKNRKLVYDFDFDFIDDIDTTAQLIEQITQAVGVYTRKTIIRTRGGIHCLIHLDNIEQSFRSSWFTNIGKLLHDAKGDNLLPVPGCTQGGAMPYFILK